MENKYLNKTLRTILLKFENTVKYICIISHSQKMKTIVVSYVNHKLIHHKKISVLKGNTKYKYIEKHGKRRFLLLCLLPNNHF